MSRWFPPIVIVAAAVLAYANSFGVPFLLDDDLAVVKNPSIRNLADLGAVFAPPAGVTTTGRPLLNLSFAVNYALGGQSVGGYHAFNLAVHILASLTLYGIVRRTLASAGIALVAALFWTLHPVQTQAVTYISQRAESLMGLFYLLTLYCFLRSLTPHASRLTSHAYAWAAVAACAAGMAVKEPMVTAPVLVLLYDRVFVSGSFREAWRRHRFVHCGLAATWLLLAALMAGASYDAVGVGASAEVTPWVYALTEFKVVMRYLGLSFWPHPLVFDYGPEIIINRFSEALPWALAVAALLGATAWVWRRSPKAAFLGCAFFLLLAPTSTVVPVTFQPMAESRLYLPLAAVCVGVATVAGLVGGRRVLAGVGTLALVLLALTIKRNGDFSSDLRIWEDTLAKHSGNWRTHYTLGLIYAETPGRMRDALPQFEATVRLRPYYADARSNLAGLLMDEPGRLSESIEHAEAALRLNPNHVFAHANLGLALLRVRGREAEGLAHLEESVRIDPADAEARETLGNALLDVPGRLAEAIAHYEAAVRLKPDSPKILNSYAGALFQGGRTQDARRQLEKALAIDPNYADARSNLERLKGR